MVANWKMYKTPAESEAFIKELLPKMPATPLCDVVICPP
jgi:triosephosphate isomerase